MTDRFSSEEAALDDLLESSGFAADAEDPGYADDEPTTGDVTESDQIGAGADYPAGEDDGEPASEADAPDRELELEQLRQYAAALEQDRQMRLMQQQQAEQRALAARLEAARQQMTADEWANFQAQVSAQYALQAHQQLEAIRHQQVQQQFWSAEMEARNYAIDYLNQRMNLNETERALLETAETAPQMRQMVEVLKSERRNRTEAARGALRDRRVASGADQAGGRGTGGGRVQQPQFKDIDELVDSIFQ